MSENETNENENGKPEVAEPVETPEPQAEPASEPEGAAAPATEPEAAQGAAPEPEAATEPATEPEPASEPEAAPEPEAATEPATEPEPASEPEAAPEPEAATEPATEPEPAAEPKAAAEPAGETEAPTEPAERPAARPAAEAGSTAPARERKTRSRRHVPRSEGRQRPKRTRAGEAGTRKPIVRLEKPEHERGRRQERRGVVVSDAMDKTIVVKVDAVKAHPRYKKVIRRSVKFHAHDPQNQAHVGDLVRIAETRPLSKTKNWRLVEVLQAAR